MEQNINVIKLLAKHTVDIKHNKVLYILELEGSIPLKKVFLFSFSPLLASNWFLPLLLDSQAQSGGHHPTIPSAPRHWGLCTGRVEPCCPPSCNLWGRSYPCSHPGLRGCHSGHCKKVLLPLHFISSFLWSFVYSCFLTLLIGSSMLPCGMWVERRQRFHRYKHHPSLFYALLSPSFSLALLIWY